MSMRATFEAIKKSLCRSSAAFERGRAKHAVLAAYATPEAACAAVRPGSSLTASERERLLTALVEENQAAPAPLWQALLLVAFEPMLVRLRVKRGAPRDEDLDQALLLAFTDGLRAVRAGAYTILGVRWATEARFAASSRAPLETAEYDDDIHAGPQLRAAADKQIEASEVIAMIEARGGRELVEAIVATEVGDEQLTDYVARVYADRDQRERERVYHRLLRERDAVLDGLCKRLAPRASRAA